MFHVGFTGTQHGMSEFQKRSLRERLAKLRRYNAEICFHHGDCIGADAEAHAIAVELDFDCIVLHPPENESKRAFCKPYNILRRPLPYLTRNRTIVFESDVMFATPHENQEQLRSGTWSTIRYATKCNKKIYVILPNEED